MSCFSVRRCFHYNTAKRNNYPSYGPEIYEDLSNKHRLDHPHFRSHKFDVEPRRNVQKRIKRSHITSDDKSLRGVPRVRYYYKVDESRISALLRKGMQMS